jgi:surfactin synthase thioesterase subunit
MNRSTHRDPRVVRPLWRPASSRTLVCLSFCGGGLAAYQPWAPLLDDDTELAVVCYPGREGRFAERFATSWEELATDATRAVCTAADRPYALFGHSMGGWMAFEVATRMERGAGPPPQELVISSCNAPNRGVTQRDAFPRIDDSDDTLLDWMRTIGALPEYVLADTDLREISLELMRADIKVRDSYGSRPGVTTRLPVQILHGSDDDVIEPDLARRWRAVATGRFRVDELPGGHFYTPDVWRRLPHFFAWRTATAPAWRPLAASNRS